MILAIYFRDSSDFRRSSEKLISDDASVREFSDEGAQVSDLGIVAQITKHAKQLKSTTLAGHSTDKWPPGGA